MAVLAPTRGYDDAVASHAHAVLKVPLAPIPTDPGPPVRPCPFCGSRGFNVHQRQWKAVRDPQVNRVSVLRFQCKRCGRTTRTYPDGVGPGRQSLGLKQACLFLYCMGLSYQHVAALLADLSCSISPTTVRANVVGVTATGGPPLPGRLRLTRRAAALVAGPEGSFALRTAGPSPADRWLEIELAPGPWAAEIQSRVEHCADWAQAALLHDRQFPPETA
jgi:hypothetical protein